jgi:alpha-glucosidase (family GH31 glycosyl hydrolase)
MKMSRWNLIKTKLGWKALVIILFVALVISLILPKGFFFASLGNITGVTQNGDTLEISIDSDKLFVQICKPELLKVNFCPKGVMSPNTPVIGNTKWSAVGATIDTTSNPITITTNRMVVKINKTPCRISVYDKSNRLLLKEQDAKGVYDGGLKLNHNPGENFYGARGFDAWENSSAGMLRNGTIEVKAGMQGHCGAPMVFTTKYSLLVDSEDGIFTINDSELNFSNVSKKNVEYYIAVGTPLEVLPAFFAVSGKPPMFPAWATGFMNFEWGLDQAELESHVNNYRVKQIPIDVFTMDFDGINWPHGNYGEFQWNPVKFPGGANGVLKSKMDGQGVKLGIIRKPRIVVKNPDGTMTKQAKDVEAKEKSEGNWWYPGLKTYRDYTSDVYGRDIYCRDVNFYNSNVRKWFWEHNKDFFTDGIRLEWIDETDQVSAKDGYTFNFGSLQGFNMARAIYDGQRSISNDRVCSINRNFYLGAQRYACGLWSGDINANFSTMAAQRERLLSAVNVGAIKWGQDTGGFENVDIIPQLYTRWIQFSSFVPIFRVHANRDKQRQPWYFGFTGEEVAKRAIQLRYSLIPYIYPYEREAYETGIGLVRPLFYEYPDDATVINNTEAWFFGKHMMVAPVVEFGQNSKRIYLPKGVWYDYFRGDKYSGGQTINYSLDSATWHEIPVFAREGAIIPTRDVQNYIGEKPAVMVNVDVFPGPAQSHFTYYDDNEVNYDYEKGAYFKQQISVQDKGASGISFNIGAVTGSYKPALKFYLAAIHGKAGNSVKINGAGVTHYPDLNALKTAPGEGWAIGRDLYGAVTYVKVAAQSTKSKNIVIFGTVNVTATTMKYEAEEASLMGGAAQNTNHSGYSGAGFADGFTKVGVAATFSVNVKTGGVYNVALRYANATGSPKTLSVFINSDNVLQAQLPSLANWNTWGNQTEPLPLLAGNNIITYKYEDNDSGNVNLDYITVPFDAEPGKYEAESADLSGTAGTNTNHFFYSGGAYVDKIESVSAGVNFKVFAFSAGIHNVALRYANATGTTQTLSLIVNGAKIKQVSLPGLPDWNQWSDKVEPMTLKAGMNTITYQYLPGDTGHVNIDRILVSKTVPKPPITENNLIANGNFEQGNIAGWMEWHDPGLGAAYGVNFYDVHTGDKKCYFDRSSAYKQSIHQVCSVANGNYRMSAYVWMKNNKPNIARIEVVNYGGTAPIYQNIPQTGKWTYITVDNIPVTSGKVDVGFYVDSPGGTTLCIDDIKLMKK